MQCFDEQGFGGIQVCELFIIFQQVGLFVVYLVWIVCGEYLQVLYCWGVEVVIEVYEQGIGGLLQDVVGVVVVVDVQYVWYFGVCVVGFDGFDQQC